MNYVKKILLNVLFLSSLGLYAQTITPSTIDYHINKKLDTQYSLLYTSMGNASTDPYDALYNSELALHNILKYALQKNDIRLLEKLITLFVRPLQGRYCSSQYKAYYCGNNGYSNIQLPQSYCYWRYPSTELETTLSSAQFLAMISQAINGMLSLPYRTIAMNDFINTYKDVLILDHYDRWINGTSFEMITPWANCTGSQCGNYMNIIDYRLANTTGAYSYCNAVIDNEMWILDGVSNILAANAKSPTLVPIPQNIKNQFEIFLEKGIQLIKNRTQNTVVTNFSNSIINGSILDEGKWSSHPDYRYSGYIGTAFPGCLPNQYNANVGMDISHASRLTYLLSDLYFNYSFIPTATSISYTDVQKIANQFAYKIFNKNFYLPAFSNFWDGSNGWFRVNYSNRKGFGYAPSSLSTSIAFGYGFLQKFNPDIKTIFYNQLDFIQSSDSVRINFLNATYIDRGLSNDYCISGPEMLSIIQDNFDKYMLYYLPNLFTWDPLTTNNDSKENPFMIYAHDYKTPNALYTTSVASADGSNTSCTGSPKNNLWFSFVATKPSQSVFILSGNGYGSIQTPVISLWNYDASTEIACYSGNTTNNAFLSTNTLTVGNTYLISVDNYSPTGKGSFTLFTNDSEIQTLQSNNGTTPSIGVIRYNGVFNKFQGYNGKWVDFN